MDSVYFEVAPHPSLRPYIEAYWVSELPKQSLAFEQMILPDHCTDLIFDVGATTFNPFGPIGSKVIGVMTKARGSLLVPGNKLLGIRFKPYGAAAVFGISANELMDLAVDIDSLSRNDFDIRGRLMECGTSEKPIKMLDDIFISKVNSFRPIHKATERAVSIIARSGGSVSVSTLAEALGLTRRHLSRLFAENVGLAPKEFLRIERFRAVVKVIDSAQTQPEWSILALEYGFYDQAHFVGEFARIMGVPPHRYWKKSA